METMRWPSLAAVVATLVPSFAFAEPLGGSTTVSTLRTFVPDADSFVVHGTIPVPLGNFNRFHCPYQLVTSDGEWLHTQWELVATLQDRMIVELRAIVPDNRWTGQKTFTVKNGHNSFDLRDFDLETLALAATSSAIELVVQDQGFVNHRMSVSGYEGRLHRIGPATVTLEHRSRSAFGVVQSWLTVDALSEEIELVMNWNNGTLPAAPDVFFRSLRLEVPPGWTYTTFLPDPAVGDGYLCKPDWHVLPQRMERSFRVIVHKTGQTPDLSRRGWAVGDWSEGGYTAQSVSLPTLDHVAIDLSFQKDEEYGLLANNQASIPGAEPVSFLWPAYGVKYGGMTGGIHVDQVPAVPTAVTGQPDGLLTLFVEQLRYGARQMGCIYAPDGDPIEMDDYLDADGTAPWVMFNNVFFGNPPKDEPFDFADTGPGTGFAAYDPSVFAPIDDQHLVRRTKANKALIWLDNDPLARLYTRMDAELARMKLYEGPEGRLKLPDEIGQGAAMGRAHAWAADVMLTAYAISDQAWRTRNLAWYVRFVLALYRAQMPNKLFSALDDGKVAEDPPYGHLRSEPCPQGIHSLDPESGNAVSDFWVHRGNEQIFLVDALRGIQQTVGIPCNYLIRTGGEGIWNFAWKPGTNGVLDRYPAGPANGPRYAFLAQAPAGLIDSVPRDSYHPGNALAFALLAGAEVAPGFFALTSTESVELALGEIESWGIEGIANFVQALTILQNAVP